MAGKLTPDEIKWILSIDAKGANKEIAVTSSEINKLAHANKLMAQDMKAAEKQIKNIEREMAKLKKAGKEDTDAFRELQATHNSARADIDSYTQKIGENNRAISDNKKKIEELTAGMDLNEMSMKQLKNRSRELQMQLNATSASANPQEYKMLQNELEKVNTRIFAVQNQGKGLISQFAAMNNPVGQAAQAVQGFGQALKALIANPVGIVVMAIVAAFYALKVAIAGSDEATTKYEGVMAALNSMLDNGKRILTEYISMLGNLIKLDFKAVKENIRNLSDMGETMVENAKAAYDAAIAEDALNDAIARNNDLTEVNRARIAELRQISKDTTKSVEERKKASDELLKLENDNYKMAVSNISGQYEVWKGKNKNLIDAMRLGNKTQFAEVEKYMQMVQDGTELTYEQRLELAQLVNDITTTLDRGTEEEKEKFRSFFSELSSMQEQYFTENRRDVVTASRIAEDARRDAAQAAKEALERKISAVDYALKEETKLLKQNLAEQKISQTQYDQELEQKALESLHKKLEITGLEKDARIEIEQQILDYKIKALELEKSIEKERISVKQEFDRAVMTDHERELQDIRDKGNKRIEELKLQLEKELITELQFNEYSSIILETQEKELAEKRRMQDEALATKKLLDQNKELEAEKMIILEQYATGLISKEEYNNKLLELDRQYALKSLKISNLSDSDKLAARKKILDATAKQQDDETKKQEEEQKKRTALYSQFSEQIGTMLGGVISGNEDLVKSSLKTIINIALDALEAQITMAIASAAAQSFAQADSVATFGASGAARAAVLTALIKGAFAGVKAIVNSKMSGSNKKSNNNASSTSTKRVVGRESGGFFEVERDQDRKKYLAKYDPSRRGFINNPTILVGDGPAGKSREWVASNDALQNPTIAPFIRMLDDAQQAGNIRTIDLNHLMRSRMAGFQSGGFVDKSLSEKHRMHQGDYSSFNSNENINLFNEIKGLLLYLKNNGIKSSVNYHEFKRVDEKIESIKAKARRS